MDKEFRKELVRTLHMMWSDGEPATNEDVDKVIPAIDKLYKSLFLKEVGEDEGTNKYLGFNPKYALGKMVGRNQLRAELRKKINE